MNIDFVNIPESISEIYFDIGLSYYAPYSQDWLNKLDNILVIGIEPNPKNIKHLKDKQEYKVSDLDKLKYKYMENNRFQLMECAISNTCLNNEYLDFYNFKGDDGQNCSSLYKFKDDLCKSYHLEIEQIKVPVYNLEYFLKQIPYERFPYVTYIKIDTQGSDLNVLKSAGNFLSERVVYVTAEPDGHQYENASDCNIENINNYMLSQNFIKVNHSNTKDPTYLNKNFIHLKDKYICQKY